MITFKEKLEKTKNHRSSVQAQKGWPFLVSLAVKRQTIRYPEFFKFLGYGETTTGHGQSASILGNIRHYCIDNNIPVLSDLVVNVTGRPGHGEIFDHESIFEFDWYEVVMPSAKKLAEHYDAHSPREARVDGSLPW